jgi:CDP-diacylglycerol--serine O-phosphatidyltransferase
MNYLADFLTILSLVCGFFSVVLSLGSHFTFASWAIVLSVIFDGLDGQIARKNSAPSEFGEELDSLVDVVSFGIAPSILGYTFIYRSFHFWPTLALFFYLFCSVMRLAKYNITPREEMASYFYGLPTTISGGVLASFILMYRKKDYLSLPRPVPFVFLIIVVILAVLMVSRVKYLNLDGLKQIVGKKTKLTVLALVVLLTAAAFTKRMGVSLFTLFVIYLIFSPFVVKRLDSHT